MQSKCCFHLPIAIPLRASAKCLDMKILTSERVEVASIGHLNMISIQQPHAPPQLQLNLLPCRIDHTGPCDISEFFKPEAAKRSDDSNGFTNCATSKPTQVAYFRGRRLFSTHIDLPESYRGIVLDEPKTLQTRQEDQDMDDDDESQERIDQPTKKVSVVGTFSSLTVWGHDTRPDEIGLMDGEIGTGILTSIKEWVGGVSNLINSDEDN